jgi:hypothetical protein
VGKIYKGDDMNIKEMTSKQISDELSNRGVTMHFNSKREKLEEALIATDDVDVAVLEPEVKSNVVFLTEEDLIANDFKVNGVELEGARDLHAMKLIRVIVRSNDPLERESAGKIFTVGNREINGGKAVKKYIPFNNEEGWHIPHILYEHLLAAECQIFAKVKRNGQELMEPQNIKAFNVEVLPPLTEEEREKLAVKQKSTGSVG